MARPKAPEVAVGTFRATPGARSGKLGRDAHPPRLVEQLRNFLGNVQGATVGVERKLNRGEIGGFSYTLPGNLYGQGYGWRKGDRLYLVSISGTASR